MRYALLFLLPTFLLSATAERAMAAGDVAAGQAAFSTCHACHSPTAGTNGIAPSLADVVGRPSGSVSGYNYSPAMKAAHLTWDATTLDKFLTNPQALVHGTKMFISVANPATRQNIIAYLSTLK
jgi:cytochrome c2